MKKEKLYSGSEVFLIFKNYGVLGAEKRNVYTYAGSHPQGVCSDEMEVRLPKNSACCFEYRCTGSSVKAGQEKM